MGLNLLALFRPLSRVFPSVRKPLAEISTQQKTIYTAIALFIYLICSQIPLFGIIRNSYDSDPLYWARVILASSKGTLMELGISPIISAGWIMQLMDSFGLMKIDSADDHKTSEGIEKILALVFCFGQAIAAVTYGVYGPPAQLGAATMALIVGQLVTAGFIVILLDDLLKKGYGLGSGISLFIVANTSEVIFWSLFSPITHSSEFGVEFTGSFICLVHFLFTKSSFSQAVYQAFTREQGNNLTEFTGAVVLFAILIYLHRFHLNVKLIHQKHRGYSKVIPVKLFFTSNMSVILQTMVISQFYVVFKTLTLRYKNVQFFKWISTWDGNSITGGLLWYISPPENIADALLSPLRLLCYTAFVCLLCAQLSKFWIVVAKATPKDYAYALRSQELTLEAFERESVIRRMEETIPVAAMLGGAIIGLLTVMGDIVNVSGSATGIMLSISILYGYYEKISSAGRKVRSEKEEDF